MQMTAVYACVRVQTETLTIKATPLEDGMVKAKTGNSTDSTIYDAWCDAVFCSFKLYLSVFLLYFDHWTC